MNKSKRKARRARVRPTRRRKFAWPKFVPSTGIIYRSVTVEEAEAALIKKAALWLHATGSSQG